MFTSCGGICATIEQAIIFTLVVQDRFQAGSFYLVSIQIIKIKIVLKCRLGYTKFLFIKMNNLKTSICRFPLSYVKNHLRNLSLIGVSLYRCTLGLYGNRRFITPLHKPHCVNGWFARWSKWRACDGGEAKKGLENELWRRWSDGNVGEWALFIPQSLRHFTYVTTHSPTLPSLYQRHSLFPNPSVASPTSQFILQSFFRFSYVTSSSLNSPGEPPMAQFPNLWE